MPLMQILHMVSQALSRMCIIECAPLLLWREGGGGGGDGGGGMSVIQELSIAFVNPADFWCEALKHENVQRDRV